MRSSRPTLHRRSVLRYYKHPKHLYKIDELKVLALPPDSAQMKEKSDLESGQQNLDDSYLKESKHEQDLSYSRRHVSFEILSTFTWSHIPEHICIMYVPSVY